MTNFKVTIWLITLVSMLCLLVSCGGLNSLGSAPDLVLEEVIVGTWATTMLDHEHDDWLYDGHVFEFKSNGKYVDKVNYSEAGAIATGSYVVDGSTLQYTRETKPKCIALPSTEEFEVLSIEQNKITLKMLTHTPECVAGSSTALTGADLVLELERCEWPPNAETEIFATCTPIESE